MRQKIAIGAASVVIVMLSMDAGADPQIRPDAIELEEVRGIPMIPGDTADDIEEAIDGEDGINREFVVAPLPSRSPLLGWTLAVPALVMYRPESLEPEDNTWITGATGFYAENESWGGGAFHKMSTGGDKWRFMFAAFYADLNYDFFGIGGNPDTSIPLNQPTSIVMAEALRQVYPNLFIGLRSSYSSSEVKLDIPPDILPPGIDPPDIGVKFDLTNISPRLTYDTRDNEFYPASGSYIDGTIDLGREALGNDAEYEKYKLSANWYRTLGDSGVLATRVAIQYASGDAPFFLFPAFGSGADLRGYQTGTYRDRFLFATQAEYRYRLKPRLGAVVFAGIGTSAPSFGSWEESLGSIGAGIRWVIAPKNNMSLRIDVARGRDDTEFYVGLGEAF